MKKFLALMSMLALLVTSLVLTSAFAIPVGAATEGDFTYEVAGDEATVTGFPKNFKGAVVIPNTLGGKPVTSIADSAFSDCDYITSVTIPDSVKSIGEEAFLECFNLVSVTLGAGVENIGESAFAYCGKLAEIYNFSNLDIEKAGDTHGLIGLNALDIYTSADQPSKLTTDSDGYIFYEDGETVYLMGYTGNQTSIALPSKYNGKSYAIYQFAFVMSTCTSVSVPSGVTDIQDCAFYVCEELTDIKISSGAKSIGMMAFADCDELKSVIIPDSVQSIDIMAFYSCGELTSIVIPNSVTSIAENAFNRSTALTIYCYENSTAHTYAVDKNIPFAFSKTNEATPVAPVLSSKTDTSVTLTALDGYEYKCGDGAWQDSNVFEALTANTEYTFYQRIKAVYVVESSAVSESLKVTTDATPINDDESGTTSDTAADTTTDTTSDTTSDTTADTATAENDGCGSAVGGSMAVVAMFGLAAAFVGKKKKQ